MLQYPSEFRSGKITVEQESGFLAEQVIIHLIGEPAQTSTPRLSCQTMAGVTGSPVSCPTGQMSRPDYQIPLRRYRISQSTERTLP